MIGTPIYSRWLGKRPFKQQLNRVVTLGVLLFAIASSLLISWQAGLHIHDTQVKQGLQIAANLASQSRLALLYGSADNATNTLNATLAFPDMQRAEVLQLGGQVLASAGTLQLTAVRNPALNTMAPSAYLTAETSENLYFVAPVRTLPDVSQLDGTDTPIELLGFVQVVQGKETLTRSQHRVLVINLRISLIFALLLLFALGLLAQRLTQPITALSVKMACAGGGDLSVRATPEGSKDIADMAVAFNQMMVALQDRELLAQQVYAAEAAHAQTRLLAAREHAEREQQRRFLAMLTHELKTPLSVIRMRLGSPQPSDNMQKHALVAIADMDGIVERVAMASRIEDQSLKLQPQPCWLAAVLDDLLEQTPQAGRVWLDLPDDAESLQLQTDPVLLRTAIANLLDNALKYGAPADRVRITLALQPHDTQPGVLIRVENPIGPAGAPDPEQVFIKYYRAPGAHQQSGSGLGLYIVQELAAGLGGHIAYVPGPQTVCFKLWLPLQQPITSST